MTGQPPVTSALTPGAPTTPPQSFIPTSTPLLPTDLKDRFVIAPELIASYDRFLLVTILGTIPPEF
eukprot:5943902-Pleurochrysis_carterae.AAC.1